MLFNCFTAYSSAKPNNFTSQRNQSPPPVVFILVRGELNENYFSKSSALIIKPYTQLNFFDIFVKLEGLDKTMNGSS